MKSLWKNLLLMFACLLGFSAGASALTLVVQYKPYGVPDSRRAEYEAKIAQRNQHAQLLATLSRSAKPVAVVPETVHDFGMIDPHCTASHAFEIRNEGSDPLALEVRGTSCKCTVGKLENDVLLAGQCTTVTMTWNTGYQAEQYEQTATVLTNDPLQQEIHLKVKGEVRAEFIAPTSVAFGGSDPAEQTEAKFVVFSQLWDDFTVTNVECDLESFDWYAEPVEASIAELADKQAQSAWQVRIFTVAMGYGEFTAQIKVTAEPNNGGDPVVRTLQCTGKVRSPINFYSPEIHVTDGLDMGTLVAGKEHNFHLVVRARGQLDREIEVLDVKPDQLEASLARLPTEGSYRLTLTVPADCPMVVFNAAHQHGYVQVGDPKNKNFSNWFPLHGAVITLEQ